MISDYVIRYLCTGEIMTSEMLMVLVLAIGSSTAVPFSSKSWLSWPTTLTWT